MQNIATSALRSAARAASMPRWMVADQGAAVGFFGTILRTKDGGETWTAEPGGTLSHLNAVCFAAPRTAVIAGGGGTILRTE